MLGDGSAELHLAGRPRVAAGGPRFGDARCNAVPPQQRPLPAQGHLRAEQAARARERFGGGAEDGRAETIAASGLVGRAMAEAAAKVRERGDVFR